MTNAQTLVRDDETIHWQGEPEAPVLSVKSVLFCLLPGLLLLLLWSGCIEYGGDHPILKKACDFFLQDDVFIRSASLVLIIGLIASPFVRWFLYYKRIAYVFTESRAIAYYKDTHEVAFQVEASDILQMQRSYRGENRVSLYTYIREDTPEDQGVARLVRVGFEGIPAHVLDFYK